MREENSKLINDSPPTLDTVSPLILLLSIAVRLTVHCTLTFATSDTIEGTLALQVNVNGSPDTGIPCCMSTNGSGTAIYREKYITSLQKIIALRKLEKGKKKTAGRKV